MSKVSDISVFRRLFIVYSLIILIIYIVLIVVFLSSINRTSNELVLAKKTQTQAYLKNIEQQFDSIYKQQVNLVNNASISKLAYSIYSDNYEKTQLLLDLQQNIESIQGMNSLIEDIVITFPNQAITVSAISGYLKEEHAVWDNIKTGSVYNSLITYKGKIILNFTYPLMYSVNDDYIPDYNIQIILSKALLSESLNVFEDERGNGAAIWFQLDDSLVIENETSNVMLEYVSELKNITFGKKGDLVELEKDYQFVTTDSGKYPIAIIAFINRQIINQNKVKYIIILTLLMLFISVMFIFSLLYSKKIVVKPLLEMMSAFGKIQKGDFDVRIYHEPHDEFNYLYHGFNEAVAYIQELIANIYEQENLIQNAELAQLQSQINPHFLYNSFFIIKRMAKNESYEQIDRFVTSLAKYYRFINKETESFIPLVNEVDHMSNYIDIQQMRFGEKINIEIDELPEDIKSVKVPKLILQPIIENAYNYGLINKLEKGLIRVSYFQENNMVYVCIEDNGEDADPLLIERINGQLESSNFDGGNHALFNINRRLKLAFGKHCGLEVFLGQLGGVKVTMTLDKDIELNK